MKTSERVLNICFGLSILYWGIAGFLLDYKGADTAIIRWFITVLNITVGSLIIFRSPVIKNGSYSSILISLPSLICGGLLFKLANPLEMWDYSSVVLFIIGGCIAFVSFLFLGRNFSIFPGVRKVVTNGLFRIVRHPSYLGESLMITSCLLEAENMISLIPFVVFIPSILVRISEEEKLLTTNKSYQVYKEKVKWRLIPFVW